jgi:two-component system, OmpR family, sensor histidine kinase MprB
MTLRTRLTLVVGLTAAAAIIAAVFAASVVTKRELIHSLDQSLINTPLRAGLEGRNGQPNPAGPGQQRDLVGLMFQVLDSSGAVREFPQSSTLPIDEIDRQVARDGRRDVIRSVSVDGEAARMLTRPTRNGAVQIARSLDETQATMAAVRRRMLLLGAVGVALAAFAAWVIGSREARPIQRLTAAAEEVAATQNLGLAIPHIGSSEVGRLSRSMSSMLAALDTSKRQQQRLIQDASHELRTPLTSLRANAELLRRFEELSADDRAGIVDDMQRESEELTALVAEMVDLATDHRLAEATQAVDLRELADSIASRFSRRSGRTVTVVEDSAVAEMAFMVDVRRSQLERAISNLVENAIKFSGGNTPVEIQLGAKRVVVRDHGPGIPEADLPRIFDRFYRADATRTMPGSGLGLAIVQQFVTDHHGHTLANNAIDGGAEVGFTW